MSRALRPHPTLRASAVAAALLVAGACTPSDATEPNVPPPPPTTGQVVFWTSDPRLVPSAVTVNGRSAGSVTSGYGAAPNCGAGGGATMSLPAGSYPWSATSASGYTGSGTVSVYAGSCTAVQLYAIQQPQPTTSTTTGRVIFWTRSASLAPIAVRVDGQTVGSVSAATGGAPSCGQSTGLNVSLSAGRHSMTGSNPRGDSWSGPIDIQAGGCLVLELY